MTPETTLDPDAVCPRCERRRELCVCDRTAELATGRRVLILQHPREQDVDLGSARLAAMSLAAAKLRVGLSWGSLAQALGEDADPGRWALVFPAADEQATSPFAVVDRKGEPLRRGKIQGIVVLDGSWSQAKTLRWRNPWLSKLNRITLRPAEPSIYGSLRPEPRREYVSTLEAIGAALTGLGEDPAVEAQLRRLFRTLVQRARDTGAPPKGAGRAARLKRRRKARSGRGPKPSRAPGTREK